MDKTILGTGFALTGLGLGLLVTDELNHTFHQSFTTEGYLWLAIGVLTCGLGLKVMIEKSNSTKKRCYLNNVS